MNPPSQKVRVILVAGDGDVRVGLAERIAAHPFLDVIGIARNGRTALPKITGYAPEWVVVDLASDPADGMSLLSALHAGGLRVTVLAIHAEGADPSGELRAQLERVGVRILLARPTTVDAHALGQLASACLAPLLRAGSPPLVAASQPPSKECTPPSTAVDRSSRPAAPALPATPMATPMAAIPVKVRTPGRPAQPPAVVGIGVSTGGPAALGELLPQLSPDFPLPILIVQHMPAKFTQSLAESLARTCKLAVAEASDGDEVVRGRILIAPGGRHMRVTRDGGRSFVETTEDPPECSCRPSVDYLFRSLVQGFGGRVLGVVLTGMGEDGWLGARAIHAAGGQVLAQDEASCTVYGMPRGPIEAGVAAAVPLARMAETIMQCAGGVLCN